MQRQDINVEHAEHQYSRVMPLKAASSIHLHACLGLERAISRRRDNNSTWKFQGVLLGSHQAQGVLGYDAMVQARAAALSAHTRELSRSWSKQHDLAFSPGRAEELAPRDEGAQHRRAWPTLACRPSARPQKEA